MENLIVVQVLQHKKQGVYALFFNYNYELKELCKTSGAQWSTSKKAWYYPLNTFTQKEIAAIFKNKATLDFTNISKQALLLKNETPIKFLLNTHQKEHLNKFYLYLKGKRFSKSTLKTYSYLIAEFIVHQPKNTEITRRSIEKHSENVLAKNNRSISTHRQFISAIKHYLTFTGSTLVIDFNSLAPKKDKKLPNVLSCKEVIELIRVTKNLKHRVCISMLYSSGLRIGELIQLKLCDLDLERKLLKVHNGKGRKDRYVPIANSMMPMLQNYLTTYTPKTFLIEGTEANKTYSSSAIRNFLQKNCKLANINKKITPHTLRHSYATHLLENGTDIRYIQELLGHAKPETTMVYTHVRSQDLQKITNPLDLIVKQLENSKRIS